MQRSVITCIVNGNAYALNAADVKSMEKLLPADRQQLVDLLEAIKRQNSKREREVEKSSLEISALKKNIVPQEKIKPERMSSQDIDDLMAKLIREEQQNKKPRARPSKRFRYLAIAVLALALIALIL